MTEEEKWMEEWREIAGMFLEILRKLYFHACRKRQDESILTPEEKYLLRCHLLGLIGMLEIDNPDTVMLEQIYKKLNLEVKCDENIP